MRCIDDNKFRVIEGQLRCAELSKYLDNLKTVKAVWIAEDATAIISKITYDPATNQLVGILLPLNGNTHYHPSSIIQLFSKRCRNNETLRTAIKIEIGICCYSSGARRIHTTIYIANVRYE